MKERSSNSPRISILTPSFNQGSYIEENIQSVLKQNYPNFEHIIIDGGSTDGTVAILKKYPHLKWVSEKDRGQADALNKGLAMATGEIIGWINSDDYYENNIFREVAHEFDGNDVQWAVGNLTLLLEEINEKLPRMSPPITYKNLVNNPDIVRQPVTFFRKSSIESIGGWNPDLYMVMDYDLWIRLAKKTCPKMVGKNWAYFRLHAGQKSSYKNILTMAREIQQILKNEGVSVAKRKCFLVKRYWYVLKGAIKAILIKSGFIDEKYANIPLSIRKELQGNQGLAEE